jgi:hypothetical protein
MSCERGASLRQGLGKEVPETFLRNGASHKMISGLRLPKCKIGAAFKRTDQYITLFITSIQPRTSVPSLGFPRHAHFPIVTEIGRGSLSLYYGEGYYTLRLVYPSCHFPQINKQFVLPFRREVCVQFDILLRAKWLEILLILRVRLVM